ncbi:hypothetical protein BJ085DRAFT_31252 [Dimargaris cristalligena]|uniref:Zn(2)-C6 fungal-type domain-containing protein n=1 Tax=Dimargaris cristalligena TaxID=215637 RepID=A0A4P9ZUI6_9FUNG|nr:hypothetical protein BJ085DRAFT_31252 [Dimargaris cristalligena]|eukprot:RKP37213.1 hypothetical protein BJ085DRAFT_31252 [Dimargaris cristalligena]
MGDPHRNPSPSRSHFYSPVYSQHISSPTDHPPPNPPGFPHSPNPWAEHPPIGPPPSVRSPGSAFAGPQTDHRYPAPHSPGAQFTYPGALPRPPPSPRPGLLVPHHHPHSQSQPPQSPLSPGYPSYGPRYPGTPEYGGIPITYMADRHTVPISPLAYPGVGGGGHYPEPPAKSAIGSGHVPGGVVGGASSSIGLRSSTMASSGLPRPTNTRPKLYVSKACINCRNSKVACDNDRPCARCIKHNKASTCRDAVSKRRGRPGGTQSTHAAVAPPNLDDPSRQPLTSGSTSGHISQAVDNHDPSQPIIAPTTPAQTIAGGPLSGFATATDHSRGGRGFSLFELNVSTSGTSSAALSSHQAPQPQGPPAKTQTNYRFRTNPPPRAEGSRNRTRRVDEDGMIHYQGPPPPPRESGRDALTITSSSSTARPPPPPTLTRYPSIGGRKSKSDDRDGYTPSSSGMNSPAPKAAKQRRHHPSECDMSVIRMTDSSKQQFQLQTPSSFRSPFQVSSTASSSPSTSSRGAGAGPNKPYTFSFTTPASITAALSSASLSRSSVAQVSSSRSHTSTSRKGKAPDRRRHLHLSPPPPLPPIHVPLGSLLSDSKAPEVGGTSVSGMAEGAYMEESGPQGGSGALEVTTDRKETVPKKQDSDGDTDMLEIAHVLLSASAPRDNTQP